METSIYFQYLPGTWAPGPRMPVITSHWHPGRGLSKMPSWLESYGAIPRFRSAEFLDDWDMLFLKKKDDLKWWPKKFISWIDVSIRQFAIGGWKGNHRKTKTSCLLSFMVSRFLKPNKYSPPAWNFNEMDMQNGAMLEAGDASSKF